MKKTNIKLKAGVFVVALLFLATTVTVNADPPPVPHSTKAIELPDYQVLWQRTWFNGDKIHGEAGRVAVDSQNNVITCGMDNYENPVLIKYSSDGDELWTVEPTPLSEPVDLATLDPDFQPTKSSHGVTLEQRETFLDGVFSTQLWDVVVDSEDNIISSGWRIDSEDGSGILIVVKHDPDGNQLWNNVYSFLPDENGIAMGASLAVDSNDNVYVAGTAMVDEITSISANGVAIKLGSSYGLKHWVRIHSDVFLRVYTGVDVDVKYSDRLFFTGYGFELLSTPPYGEYITMALEVDKCFGQIVNENYIENDMFAVAMAIDQVYNRIYIVGSVGIGGASRAMIVKLDFSLNVIYQSLTEPIEHYQDVAIFDDGRLVLASLRIGSQYTISICSKEDGTRLAKYAIGTVSETANNHVTATAGVAVDSNRDVLASGGIGAIDTIKTRIFDEIITCTQLGKPVSDLFE